MATLQELTERLRGALGQTDALGRTIKLDLKGEGFIHIDGAEITNEDKAADLTVRISRKDLEAMGKRQLDPMAAIMTGRLKLSDMGLAMSLESQIQALFSKMA